MGGPPSREVTATDRPPRPGDSPSSRGGEPQHAPQNAMDDPGEIARFYDRGSALMRALLDALAEDPGRPRPFPEIEDAIGWPRRRIAAVLGGAGRVRQLEFGGRRPYRFHEPRQAASGRWEMWMDGDQAAAVRAARDY